jgi:hypothetical protein
VQVDFTTLEHPHLPARAHREEEIKLHKKRQEETDAVMNSVSVADRHPAFLKDKGDALFQQGNYHAALNAYGSALALEADGTTVMLTCKCVPLCRCYRHAACVFSDSFLGCCPMQHCRPRACSPLLSGSLRSSGLAG